jgi:hypothetical protein
MHNGVDWHVHRRGYQLLCKVDKDVGDAGVDITLMALLVLVKGGRDVNVRGVFVSMGGSVFARRCEGEGAAVEAAGISSPMLVILAECVLVREYDAVRGRVCKLSKDPPCFASGETYAVAALATLLLMSKETGGW